MSEQEPMVRRRNRMKNHYTITSNVLLFGYHELTDGEKLTYQIIDSFDWSDGAGLRKGFAFPSERRIAQARRLDPRTIRRHIGALEKAKLLTRQFRPGRPSILWIEEPSDEEKERYLSTVASPPDTDVRSTPDTGVRPYKKVKREERQNRVNAVEKSPLSEEDRAKQGWLAGEMLQALGDQHSLGFYRKVASAVPETRVFEALSEVRTAAREGRAHHRGRLFTAIIRRHLVRATSLERRKRMSGEVDITALVPGDRVRTLEGSVAEVVKPSDDGSWILVRYVAADDATLLGQEDLCSGADLSEVLERASENQR